jgi:hypothetical protein
MTTKKNQAVRSTLQKCHRTTDRDVLKYLTIIQYIAEIDRKKLTRAELTEALAAEMYENKMQVQEPQNPRNAGVTPFFLGQIARCIQFERMARGQNLLRPVELRKRLESLRETLLQLLPSGSQGLPHLREFATPLKRQTVERWCNKIEADSVNTTHARGVDLQIEELKKSLPTVFEELIK